MADDSQRFNELFSQLSNSLQTALFLASQRVTTARADAADADQLLAAVSRAASAVRAMRPTGGDEGQ
jgi:hypothetical protein